MTTHNAYQRTAAWLFALFLVIALSMLLMSDVSGSIKYVTGGILGACIAIAWERGK